MNQAVVFNTTPNPLTVSVSGRSVGGGEWGSVDLDDIKAQKHLSSGALTLVDKPEGESADDAALAAFQRVEQATPVVLDPQFDPDSPDYIDPNASVDEPVEPDVEEVDDPDGVVDEDDEEDTDVDVEPKPAPKKIAKKSTTASKK